MPFVGVTCHSQCCIYCIENMTKKKFYVGQTRTMSFRKQKHKDLLQKGTHFSATMQADYNAGDKLRMRILEAFPADIPQSVLDAKERAYIEKTHAIDNGYNQKPAPLSNVVCEPCPERYAIDPNKVASIISAKNKKQKYTFWRVEELCHLLHCQPGDILEYIED